MRLDQQNNTKKFCFFFLERANEGEEAGRKKERRESEKTPLESKAKKENTLVDIIQHVWESERETVFLSGQG